MNTAARENFRQQAGWCERLGSPFTARLCRLLHDGLDEQSAFGRRLLNWSGNPEADAIALRACAAFAFLARKGEPNLGKLYPPNLPADDSALERGIAQAIGDFNAELTAFLDSAPQTNEVGRSAILLPAYLEIAARTGLPLSIREIGASAGLNLWFDQYHYVYGDSSWGPAHASVHIACDWRGDTPPPSASLQIADRRGCDLAPIDPSDERSRDRMLAYVWADQNERLARAEAAMRLAATWAVRVEAIDAARFVAREFAAPSPGRALTLTHTIFWQYLPAATKAALRATMAEAAERATAQSPLAWLRLEAESEEKRGAVLRLSIWPDGPVDAKLAVASFHGAWIDWQGVA